MATRRSVYSLVLIIVACGGIASPTTTSEPSNVVGEVTLVRSGGFAGTTTTVTVQTDGTILITNNSEALPGASLPEPELDLLHAIVSDPEFAELRRTFVSPNGVCCDLYTYTVTAEVGDKFIESTTADTVETPRNLQQVINILTALIP